MFFILPQRQNKLGNIDMLCLQNMKDSQYFFLTIINIEYILYTSIGKQNSNQRKQRNKIADKK